MNKPPLLGQQPVKQRRSIETCTTVDECRSWADKADALAAYARRINDDGLRQMAAPIRARVVRRLAELMA